MSNLVEPYQNPSLFFQIWKDARRIGMNSSLIKKLSLAGNLSEFKKRKNIEWIEVPQFLEDFRKKDSEAGFSDYFVSQFYCNWRAYFSFEHNGNYSYERLFPDSNYLFILHKNGLPLSMLGFESQLNAVLISQIQGVKGRHDLLKSIKWPNALVNIAVQWAEHAGISEVQILPHERSKWGRVKDNSNGAKFYYDITAKKEGFKYDSEMKVYRRFITV